MSLIHVFPTRVTFLGDGIAQPV